MTQESLDRAYRPWQIRIFASTWLAYAGYYFCRKPFYVVKADMSGALGLSTIQLGHLGTAYLAAYAAGQFSSAYFGRKLGPKLLLIAGMGISAACNFVFGAANGFWTLMLFLAINGLAQGTGWPGCIGSLAFWFRREQRGSVLGFWSTCYQLGSLVSTSFAAYMLGRAGAAGDLGRGAASPPEPAGERGAAAVGRRGGEYRAYRGRGKGSGARLDCRRNPQRPDHGGHLLRDQVPAIRAVELGAFFPAAEFRALGRPGGVPVNHFRALRILRGDCFRGGFRQTLPRAARVHCVCHADHDDPLVRAHGDHGCDQRGVLYRLDGSGRIHALRPRCAALGSGGNRRGLKARRASRCRDHQRDGVDRPYLPGGDHRLDVQGLRAPAVSHPGDAGVHGGRGHLRGLSALAAGAKGESEPLSQASSGMS